MGITLIEPLRGSISIPGILLIYKNCPSVRFLDLKYILIFRDHLENYVINV